MTQHEEAPTCESIRMAYRAVSIAEYRHKAVASLLEAFEPNPPQWARDAVRAAWDDVLAARAAEARMMEEG